MQPCPLRKVTFFSCKCQNLHCPPSCLCSGRLENRSFLVCQHNMQPKCGCYLQMNSSCSNKDDCVNSPKVLNNNPPCDSLCTSQNLLPKVIILLNRRRIRKTHNHIIASEIIWEVPALDIETQIGTDWVQTQMNIPHPFMSERNARYAGFPAMRWRSGSTFTMRGFSIVSARTSACVWRILSVQELTRVVSNRKTTNWQRNHWCERCADWACKLIKECGR